MYEVYNAVPNAVANLLNILDYNFLVFVFHANVQYHAYNNYGGRHHAWRESYIFSMCLLSSLAIITSNNVHMGYSMFSVQVKNKDNSFGLFTHLSGPYLLGRWQGGTHPIAQATILNSYLLWDRVSIAVFYTSL